MPRSCHTTVFAFGVLVFTCAAFPLAGQYRYRVVDLRALGMAQAFMLGHDGRVLGATAERQPVMYEDGVLVDLVAQGVPAGVYLFNAQGQFSGGLTNDYGISRGFIYDGGQMTDLGLLPGNTSAFGLDMNEHGQICGRSSGGGATRGFIYESGEMRDIGHLGYSFTHALAINHGGDIVGRSALEYFGRTHAYVYRDGVMTDLGTLGGNLSNANDINDAGVIVGFADKSDELSIRFAFVYSAGRMLELEGLRPDPDNWLNYRAEAVNNWGVVVGVSGESFVSTGGRMVALPPLVDRTDTGFLKVHDPVALNDRGEMLATGIHPEGWRHVLLVPLPLPPARLVNLSVRSATREGDQVAIAGFVLGGGAPGSVLVRAAGPALAAHGVTGVAGDPRLDVFAEASGTPMTGNDNWSEVDDPAAVAAATAGVGAFAFADGSADAALLASLPAGSYTAHATAVTPADGGVALCELYDAVVAPEAARLVNASMRVWVGTGEEIAIVGFVLAGEGPTKVLIRAVGPGLLEHGVSGVLEDPLLWLYRENRPVFGNDDWGTAERFPLLAKVTADVGAFPLADGSTDAALLAELDPGLHTVHVSGADGGTGVALIEAYVVPQAED